MTGADGRDPDSLDDHALASLLALRAGRALERYRDESLAAKRSPWVMQDEADHLAHVMLVRELAQHRPDDAVLSEEGVDDLRRLEEERVWIIDPLDGSHDYGYRDSIEWAVHVALAVDGQAVAGAVAVPGMGRTFGTAVEARSVSDPDVNRERIVITSRSYGGYAHGVADALDARLMACGSAGVKAMTVVSGNADVYVHPSGLYEWDVCAPAVVAEAAGFFVSDLNGEPIEYNKRHPAVRGLLIAPPELADIALGAL